MTHFDNLPIYDEVLSSDKDKASVTLVEKVFSDNVKTRSDLGVNLKVSQEDWSALEKNLKFLSAYLGQFGYDITTVQDLDGRSVIFTEAKK